MGKKLVIVESPAKAKTIGRYLGSDYVIVASKGHIRDLPSKTIGVDVNRDFKPTYIAMPGKTQVIKELKSLAADSEFVYIATDPDREGEAIAWHIAQILKVDPASSCRITFNEITKKAVKEAVDSPRSVDMDLVDAQQARRVLDRLVGYKLSPLLSSKIRKGLSGGRVQSVATKLVMDRDAEIDAFIPEEYWNVSAVVSIPETSESFKVKHFGTKSNGKVVKAKLSCADDAKKVVDAVTGKDFVAAVVKKSDKERNPYPPFTTSTLQQEASRRLGFASKRTMSVAQQLYEGIEIAGQGQTALVSYIRTDSVRISDEAVSASRQLIEEKYGKNYVCSYVRSFKNKNSAQDAHEAIRPTHFDLSPDSIKSSLSSDQYKLYKLIWDRFLSTQMAAAKINTVTLDAECNNEVFRATGETIVFPGFLAAYADINEDNADDKNDSTRLPELTEGLTLKNNKVESEQKFTTPPAHYTEATLIKAMEENGIGRPSTYAPTISTILDRTYVEKEGKAIKITSLGKVVTELLDNNFNEIVDVSFTADMEKQLDDVETGNKNWVAVLSDFYPGFNAKIEAASKELEKVKLEEEKTGEKCPECDNGELVIREGKFGKFIACSCFPECSYSKNIEVAVKGHCPKCGGGLLSRWSKKYKSTYYVCDKKGSDAECDFFSFGLPVDGKFCPTCNSFMVWRQYRGRKYTKCSNKDCVTNKKKSKSDDKEEE